MPVLCGPMVISSVLVVDLPEVVPAKCYTAVCRQLHVARDLDVLKYRHGYRPVYAFGDASHTLGHKEADLGNTTLPL